MTYVFQFNIVWQNIGWLLNGVWITLLVTVAALSAGIVFGLGFGIARLSSRPWVQAPARIYIEFFRNTPALVQLIWVYYCLPIIVGKIGRAHV